VHIQSTAFDGLRRLDFSELRDERGSFVKTVHKNTFESLGLSFDVAEEFYSISNRSVIRGMHFQKPPKAHAKLVYCPFGAVLDVLLDLRKTSATFGMVHSEELSDENCRGLFIPKGFAHGFKVITHKAIMVYKTDVVYSPECDLGIHWSSFGFQWGEVNPIISVRDRSFPALSDFVSPF
jgi:dTDP-4-dehydrorhamnose 3,5-epimerase